jgi:hypothetical protein
VIALADVARATAPIDTPHLNLALYHLNLLLALADSPSSSSSSFVLPPPTLLLCLCLTARSHCVAIFFFFVFFFLCLLFGVSEHRLALRSFRRRRRRRHSHRSDRRSSLGLDKVASHVRPVLSFISPRAITTSPPAFESDGNPIRAARHFSARRDCFGRLPRRWSRASAGSLRSISARFLLG